MTSTNLVSERERNMLKVNKLSRWNWTLRSTCVRFWKCLSNDLLAKIEAKKKNALNMKKKQCQHYTVESWHFLCQSQCNPRNPICLQLFRNDRDWFVCVFSMTNTKKILKHFQSWVKLIKIQYDSLDNSMIWTILQKNWMNSLYN